MPSRALFGIFCSIAASVVVNVVALAIVAVSIAIVMVDGAGIACAQELILFPFGIILMSTAAAIARARPLT